jgi:hypothetical protein
MMSAPSGGRGVMIRSQWRWRSMSSPGTPEGITRSATPGRRHPQALHQRRQQHVALEVVRGDREGGLPLRRIEGARGGEALQGQQQFAGIGRQLFGACGGHDAPAGFHEQGVAGNGAQFVEQVAHGGLRHAQALGGGGDAAGLHHGHQHAQEVSVQLE